MVGFSRDDPGQQARHQGPIDKNLKGDRPIEIKQGKHEHKKRNGIVVQVLDVTVDKGGEENASQARESPGINPEPIEIVPEPGFKPENNP
jgi:hypothetical protein